MPCQIDKWGSVPRIMASALDVYGRLASRLDWFIRQQFYLTESVWTLFSRQPFPSCQEYRQDSSLSKSVENSEQRTSCLGSSFNPLTPNYLYISRITPLTSKCCILYIYSTNVGTEYFKHALYSPFLSLQNAVCFIMLTCLVPVLFTFYIQGVLKLKKK